MKTLILNLPSQLEDECVRLVREFLSVYLGDRSHESSPGPDVMVFGRLEDPVPPEPVAVDEPTVEVPTELAVELPIEEPALAVSPEEIPYVEPVPAEAVPQQVQYCQLNQLSVGAVSFTVSSAEETSTLYVSDFIISDGMISFTLNGCSVRCMLQSTSPLPTVSLSVNGAPVILVIARGDVEHIVIGADFMASFIDSPIQQPEAGTHGDLSA